MGLLDRIRGKSDFSEMRSDIADIRRKMHHRSPPSLRQELNWRITRKVAVDGYCDSDDIRGMKQELERSRRGR